MTKEGCAPECRSLRRAALMTFFAASALMDSKFVKSLSVPTRTLSSPPFSSVWGGSRCGLPTSCRQPSISSTVSSRLWQAKEPSFGKMDEDKEWAKLLDDNTSGPTEAEILKKMQGLKSGGDGGRGERRMNANLGLVDWLEREGNCYLRDESSWGEAPHPMAISSETVDDLTNESSGRGLLARSSINEGAELLKIPLRMCLTKKSARAALGKDVLPSSLNEYMAIACQLIHEKFRLGRKSFYKPYMDILPQEASEVNPTIVWSQEDLDYLAGSPVIPTTENLKAKLRREYDDLLGNGLCVTHPERFPKEVFTWERWLWAFTMLFSRAIRLRNMKQGETLAMVPYADLINHSAFSAAYLDAQESGDWLFKTGEEEVILYADRSYRRMEQIYISYGPKSNSDLLLLYGFALERNPYNSVDVTVAIKLDEEEHDALSKEKVEFLKKVGRSTVVDFPCYADRYPIEMLEYLRLMQMTTEDTAGRPLTDFDYTRAVSAANEAAVYSSVIAAIRSQLSKYPTTEDDDADIIRNAELFRSLTYQQRCAVRHRRNEKRLLKRTIAAMEKQIARLGLNRGESLARAQGNTMGFGVDDTKDNKSKRKRGRDDDDDDANTSESRRRKEEWEQRLAQLGLPVDLR